MRWSLSWERQTIYLSLGEADYLFITPVPVYLRVLCFGVLDDLLSASPISSFIY